MKQWTVAPEKILIRGTNWVGDAVMSIPAMTEIRRLFPKAHIALLVRPWVKDIYSAAPFIDEIIEFDKSGTHRGWSGLRRLVRSLRERRFDTAFLLQNAFDAALLAWLAGIPERIGYRRDARGWLLTQGVEVPEPGDIPRHERFYYLELLRRAGWMERFPECDAIRFEGIAEARSAGARHLSALGLAGPVIGISPGAAYGNAKRWLPERFAEVAQSLPSSVVVVFGSASERELCQTVAAQIPGARNLAGETTLREFIDLAAACRLFLTNDSGAMHVASALGVPTLTIFGATDDTTTGPTGPLARVIREHAECSPCLLRECPIDHRCMTRVTAPRVAAEARQLAGQWTLEPKS